MSYNNSIYIEKIVRNLSMISYINKNKVLLEIIEELDSHLKYIFEEEILYIENLIKDLNPDLIHEDLELENLRTDLQNKIDIMVTIRNALSELLPK